ncbi:peptide ABC transporter substrate-binding protein, partial [Escherichia coli]|nr:peptide ABC transporter substrate-binding protein [Escherichia coli]
LAALMAGNVALASDVPTEVTLIDKQTLVRNNGAEVQSEQDTDCRLRGSG